MEMSAYSGRPDEDVLSAEYPELTVDGSEFLVGQLVHVTSGPLAGLGGVTYRQAHDGRWIVELKDVATGVYLCIEPAHLAYS